MRGAETSHFDGGKSQLSASYLPQYYVTYYLHWTILLVTGILPLAALAYLNTRIYVRIKEVQKIRTSVAHNR